jgi:glycerophosphoryl diester phosphodiesterase
MWHALSFLLAGSTCTLLCGALFAREPAPAAKLVAAPKVLVIAHRGNSSAAPENTLPAFASAVKAGADLVELDYYHSADGVPVVIHDNLLDRTTDAETVLGQAKLLVAKTPLADLRKLDAGLWFDAKFKGAKLPTLVESLETIQAGSTTLIERKGGDAAAIVKLLEEKKLLDRVVVQSFDWKYVAACRQLSPGLALAALGGKAASDEQLAGAAATGAQVIAWNHEKIGKPQIDRIHALGCKAWVYTVDDPRRAQQLINDGIDGIITNKPATMLKLARTKSDAAGQ